MAAVPVMPWQPGDLERRRLPTSCQAEVISRVSEVESQLERLAELQRNMHEDNRLVLGRINSALHGNGRDGLIVEMAKVKQILTGMTWAMSVTGVVVIGIVVKSLADLLMK